MVGPADSAQVPAAVSAAHVAAAGVLVTPLLNPWGITCHTGSPFSEIISVRLGLTSAPTRWLQEAGRTAAEGSPRLRQALRVAGTAGGRPLGGSHSPPTAPSTRTPARGCRADARWVRTVRAGPGPRSGRRRPGQRPASRRRPGSPRRPAAGPPPPSAPRGPPCRPGPPAATGRSAGAAPTPGPGRPDPIAPTVGRRPPAAPRFPRCRPRGGAVRRRRPADPLDLGPGHRRWPPRARRPGRCGAHRAAHRPSLLPPPRSRGAAPAPVPRHRPLLADPFKHQVSASG